MAYHNPHSLLNHIGNVLSRPEQLPALANVNQTTGGIWAATIRYIYSGDLLPVLTTMNHKRHHEDKFYVTTTLVFDGDIYNAPERWDNVRFSR